MNSFDEIFGLKTPLSLSMEAMTTPYKLTAIGAVVSLITAAPKIIASAEKFKKSAEGIIDKLGDLDEIGYLH